MRTPSPRSAGRCFALALLLVPPLAGVASAQVAPRGWLEPSVLAGGGPVSTGLPVERPYFLGWSARVTAPDAGLHAAAELGGIEVDARTGHVYVGARNGVVTCLHGGRVVWTADVGGALLAPPKLHREHLVVATAEGVVQVLNRVTGERRVRAILGEELVTQPVVVEEKGKALRAYVGSSAESLFAVDLELGQKLWRAHRDPPNGFTIRGFARPVVAHGAVYAGFADGTLEALDPETGAARWEKRISPPGEHLDLDALTANDASLFVASYTGGLYALEPSSGATQWRTPLPGASRLRIDGPTLLAVSPGLVTALRTGDGKPVWRFKLEGPFVTSTPAVVAGQVVISQYEGPIYFVDRISGRGEGVFSPGVGFSSPPAVAGNVVFALSNGGRVYSLVVVP